MKFITQLSTFLSLTISASFLFFYQAAGIAGESIPLKFPELVVVQMPRPKASTSPQVMHYTDGSSILRITFTPDGPKALNLTPQFLSARDPSISFDGKTIYFAGKKTFSDTWQIFQMNSDGSETVQLTATNSDHGAPLQVGTLFYLNDTTPTPQLIYSKKVHTKPVIYALFASNINGTKSRQISHNIFSDSEADVLKNGRLIFSSFSDKSGNSKQIAQLMAVSIDGTDLMTVTGTQSLLHHQRMPRAGFDDNIYFIETAEADELAGGNIVSVSGFRPLHTYKQLTDSGRYAFPCPLPDGGLIASKLSAGGDYQLISIPTEGSGKTLFTKEGYHILDSQVLAPHLQARGRSSVVGFRYNDSGVFFCMNIYQSDVENIQKLEPGSVKEVLVTEGVIDDENSHADISQNSFIHGFDKINEIAYYHRILGRAKVENDGSFQVRVPSETPLTFHLLDKEGKILASQKSWTWVMHGESRGCIGCHEDRELTPPNKFIDAVKRAPQELTPQVESRLPIAIGDDA